MKLSPAERWILRNQYKLMQMLSDRPIPLYQRAIEILESGFEDQYGYAAQGIAEEPFPADVAHEVHDILEMYSHLAWAAERTKNREILESPRLKFAGFDGNHSSDHLRYAQFLHEKGEYQELGGRIITNSHRDNIRRYRAMVRVWKSIPVGQRGIQLTDKDVLRILNAPVEEE